MSDLTVRIKADAGPLKRGMDEGARSVRGFSRDANEMGLRVAKASAVVVTAVAAIGAGVLKMASEAAQAGVEIRNLSDVAGTSTTNFQRMADASRTVGVEQEKLSDILKDVNDKFGDFQATGAGPLADFFENIAPKIGITADAFANLSGPDALQLYVDSLEKAGVSQQQMTFYLEALASDTTRLLPLLRNGGLEMNRLGDEAERAGRILSEDMIQSAVELDRELANLSNQLKTEATKAVLEYKDEIENLIRFITDVLIPSIGDFLQWVDDGVEGWRMVGRAASDAATRIRDAIAAQREGNLVSRPEGQAMSPELAALLGVGGGGGSEMPALPNPFGGDASEEARGVPPSLPRNSNMTIGGPFDASGGLLPSVSAADAARMAWEKTQEVQEEIRSGTADHEAELTRIEADATRERERLAEAEVQFKKQAMSTLYSDLSSLMSSENDKLFKIGKVAAIAEATVSGYNSAVKAYEGGLRVSGGNPAIGAAFAAASLAKTGALISQIASTSKNGGGSRSGGGGGSGGGAGASAQQQQPATTFAFTIQNDPMGFGESFARQMIEQLNTAQRNGGTIQGVIT